MIEREIKLRITDLEALRRKLRAVGFRVAHRRVFEANVVFDTPDKLLRSTSRLLRLRQAGTTYTLTFKAPPRRARHKMREEIETRVDDFSAMQTILEAIGFSPSFRYEKYRTEFRREADSGILMIDETPIGSFLELEGPAYWIDRVAVELGYSSKDYLTESYGSLFFQYREAHGLAAQNMIFRRSNATSRNTLGKTTLDA